MATGPRDRRTELINIKPSGSKATVLIALLAKHTDRQTERQYYTDLYMAGYVEYNLGRERQHNVMSFSGTHTCISRSTMNSIKRDKLLVQIKQLPSQAELGEIDALPGRYHQGSCSIKCKRRRCCYAPSAKAIVISFSIN